MDSEAEVFMIERAAGGVDRRPLDEQRDPEFERRVAAYASALARRRVLNPGQRKEFERITETLAELLDIEVSRPDPVRRGAIDRVITAPPKTLNVDRTTEVVTQLKVILVWAADADMIYATAEDERRWTKEMTSWLTWDQIFGNADPPGLAAYLAGTRVSSEDEVATRRRLYQLLVARLEDIQVHRERTTRRAINLLGLSVVLLFLLVGLDLAAVQFGTTNLGLGILAGMLGSALSGTFKARDTLLRATDIEAFRQALPAQLLAGGAAAIALIALLQAKLVTISGLDFAIPQALLATGFLAGFSEPFFLGTVGKITSLGAPTSEAAEKQPEK